MHLAKGYDAHRLSRNAGCWNVDRIASATMGGHTLLKAGSDARELPHRG